VSNKEIDPRIDDFNVGGHEPPDALAPSKRSTGQVIGIIEHDPRQGTLFAGCVVRKIGLATFEVALEVEDDLLFVHLIWPTHTVMVVSPSGHPPNIRHIVTYGPTGKPHVSPACPFTAKLVARHGA